MIGRRMRRVRWMAPALALLFTATSFAQVRFDIAFPNAVHHEAEVTMRMDRVPAGPLELRMSRSSPGRYSLHEFAKNVYNVRAVDGAGKPLTVTRPNPHQWDVSGHDGTVVVTYTLFADRGDGTYAQIDETHAHLNIPATFLFARDHHDWPIEVRFHPPEGSNWRIATQLFPTDDPMAFTAPDLQYFMDSPTELSDHALRTWTVPRGAGQGGTYEMRLAVHHTGTDAEVDAYAEMVKKVVAQEIAVFGEPPAYDSGTYTFIADYLPWASGDGMEHRNSTIISSTGSLKNNAMGLLGTVSHEYFHSWNVERIRPAALEPFDFEDANMSGELWFAEGFTSYYTPLFIRRAGLVPDTDFARMISGDLNHVINSPARNVFSAVEMAMQAPFADRASSGDPTNFANTFISYYTWGAVIGLNLDLTLRGRGKTLDGMMRHLWLQRGKKEIPYAVADLERALGEYAGDAAFAKDFFDRYVRGHQVPDYDALLAQAGFTLRPVNPGKAFLGLVQLEYSKAGADVSSTTIKGSPLYEAGVGAGDRILKLDGKALTSDAVYQQAKDRHKPGDTVEIVYEQRGQTVTRSLTFVEDPRVEVAPFEDAGRPVTAAQKAFRAAWLDGTP
ncbi:MAG: PDZ domain-containing protein [Rhodothermales bacterium]